MNSDAQKLHADGRRAGIARAGALALAIAAFACGQQSAYAGSREQAKRIHDRIVGTPPTEAKLTAMAASITAGDALAAAESAMSGAEAAPFYSVALKNFATPWTNRDQTVFAPLNDYSATIIGIVRDNHDFRRALYDDILYVPQAGYSAASNASYEALESSGANLMDTNVLRQSAQSAVNGLPADATAGVITSRAAAEAFFIDGTNRAMFRFTLLNHMCRDLEQVQDTTRAPDRIRQDVSRSPGGDSRVFLNNCVGCHSGMDPMAQAFAFYDFDEVQGRLIYTPGQVQPKYFNNEDTFPQGFVTPNDNWQNYWRAGPNKLLGWDGASPDRGAGAKSLGRELANSEAFASCQVEKVFRQVCLRSPSDDADRTEVLRITSVFRGNGYQLRRVFAETAVYCMGQ
jgi:hypothetical protein